MKIRFLKYTLAYTLPLSVALAFRHEGWYTFLPLIYGFGVIPLLELLIKPNNSNLTAAESEMLRKDTVYDWLLYMIVPIMYAFIIWYGINIREALPFSLTYIGRTLSLGLMCGVLGINVAHELGHRKSKAEQFMAKALLMISLYPHFFIEHNYGHHRNVATAEDPASARYNESLYHFWLRSIFYSYISAWRIENHRMQRNHYAQWGWHNAMLRFTILEILGLTLYWYCFGIYALIGFGVAALVGILLLETVNYIEHYGLLRKRVNENRYEKASPAHSWNSNHIVGRLFLFELSRHSDHHAHPHKKFQVLNSYEDSPQMPTGYPGMMLLATIPPLWFWLMNKKTDRFKTQADQVGSVQTIS